MKNLKNNVFLMAVAILFLGAFAACNNSETTKDETDSAMADNSMGSDTSAQFASATLEGTMPDTAVTGTVSFEQTNGEVKMMLQISVPKMANKSVAVHIHENGACGDMGKAAGGHWNPTNENHGKWGEGNFHSGDIGNVSLDGQGNGSMEMKTDRWSIGADATKDILSKGIIVHSGTDDYTSQPSGNAGSRIGCGVINKANM